MQGKSGSGHYKKQANKSMRLLLQLINLSCKMNFSLEDLNPFFNDLIRILHAIPAYKAKHIINMIKKKISDNSNILQTTIHLTHKTFHGKHTIFSTIAQCLCRILLLFKIELIVFSLTEAMQIVSNTNQHFHARNEIFFLLFKQQAGTAHILQSTQTKYNPRRPEHGLNVPHPPPALFNIRLKEIAMGTEPFPAGITVNFHLNHKFFSAPVNKPVPVRILQLFKQIQGAAYQTGIQQCYSKKIILPCLVYRLFYTPHTVTHLKASVPQRVENTICDFADSFIFRMIENHQVNIRTGEKLLPTVTTQGHKCNRRIFIFRSNLLKTINKKPVHKVAVQTKRVNPGLSFPPHLFQPRLFFTKFLNHRLHRILAFFY